MLEMGERVEDGAGCDHRNVIKCKNPVSANKDDVSENREHQRQRRQIGWLWQSSE